MEKRVGLYLFAVTLLLTQRPAEATPVFDFTIDYPTAEQVVGSSSPVQSQQTLVTASYDYNGVVPVAGEALAQASAGYGYLKGLSQTSISQSNLTGYPPAGLPHTAQEGSDFTLDNIQLIAPTGTDPSTIVYYSVNLAISGGVNAIAANGYSANSSASVSYGTGSSLGGFGGHSLGTIAYSSVNGLTTLTTTGNGLFQGWSAGITNSAVGTSDEYQARAGDMISVSLSLQTSAVVGYTVFQGVPAGSATASADFAHTAMFVTGGPVFNFFDASGAALDGWTATSTDGCIRDNQYMCSPTSNSGGGTSVPEPGTLTLLAFGMLGLFCGLVRKFRPE